MPKPMTTTQDFVNWVCGDQIIPDYLMWVFRAMTPEYERLMMGSTHQTIYMPDARQFRTPLPPLAEQGAIAAFLDHKTAALAQLLRGIPSFREVEDGGLMYRKVKLIEEYRHALITAAVTGKIDVTRGAGP
jgi:restriction endonuclease S subunit